MDSFNAVWSDGLMVGMEATLKTLTLEDMQYFAQDRPGDDPRFDELNDRILAEVKRMRPERFRKLPGSGG